MNDVGKVPRLKLYLPMQKQINEMLIFLKIVPFALNTLILVRLLFLKGPLKLFKSVELYSNIHFNVLYIQNLKMNF